MAKKRGANKTIIKENSKNINFLSKLQGSLFYPGRFFSDLKEKDIKPSLLFFTFIFLIYTILAVIIEYSKVNSILRNFSPGLIIPVLFIVLIFAAILGVIILYLKTLFLYIFIWIFRVDMKFNDVLKLRAYTSSPLIFAWIPFIGIWMAGIWGIVIEIIGLSNYAKISIARSALVILVPIIILLVIILLFVLFAFSLLLSSPAGFLIKGF